MKRKPVLSEDVMHQGTWESSNNIYLGFVDGTQMPDLKLGSKD